MKLSLHSVVIYLYWLKKFVCFAHYGLPDSSEIRDLKDCLMAEQEEKNDLNRKMQLLEKECKLEVPFHSIHTNYTCIKPVYCFV